MYNSPADNIRPSNKTVDTRLIVLPIEISYQWMKHFTAKCFNLRKGGDAMAKIDNNHNASTSHPEDVIDFDKEYPLGSRGATPAEIAELRSLSSLIHTEY